VIETTCSSTNLLLTKLDTVIRMNGRHFLCTQVHTCPHIPCCPSQERYYLRRICSVGLLDNTTQCASISTLEIPPICHSHLPLPFGRWHRSGLHYGESSVVFTARFPCLPPSAESHYTISAPYGLLTRYYNCRCIPQFVVSSPHRVWLAGGQDTIFHQRQENLVYRPSLFRSVSHRCNNEMQWASRGEPRLLSAHDRQMYGVFHDG